METAANPDTEIFELCEREDEDQILAELAGRVSDKYVYEFPSSDGPVTGLSYQGTNWACREFAKHGEVIRIVSKPEIQIDPIDGEYIIVSVVAQRFAVNQETGKEIALDSRVGVKRQWTKMQKKAGGDIIPNKFFIEHGVNKAQRNALQALLPTDFVKKVIQQALNQKKNPKGTAPAGQKPAPRPAAPAAPAVTPGAAAAGAGAAPAPRQTTPTLGAAPAKPAAAAQPPADQKPPAQPAKAADPLGTVRQKFWATLKKAANTTDDNAARALLKQLVGVDKVSALPEAALKSLGNALIGVNTGHNEMSEGPNGACIIDKSTGAILYPIQVVAPPAVDPVDRKHMDRENDPDHLPPATEEAPPADTGDQMF